jgi:putative photosynthetic complex assembly protein
MNSSTPLPSARPAPAMGQDNFPKWVLYCAGFIMAFSLISVGLIRVTGNGPDQQAATVALERSLRFEDRPDGAVAVIDGNTGELLTQVRGEQGFVRGTLRALTRERYSRNIGSGPPFLLTARTNGRMTLSDPATGEHIDLESFGPTNMAEFARFLAISPE